MPISSAWPIASGSIHGIDRTITRRATVCDSVSGLVSTLVAWSSWTLRVGVSWALHPLRRWFVHLLTLSATLIVLIALIARFRRRRSIEARSRAILSSSFAINADCVQLRQVAMNLVLRRRPFTWSFQPTGRPGIRLSRPRAWLIRVQRWRRRQAG